MEKIGLDGSCQNKRKSSIFKEPDGSIHDVDAFSKVPVKKVFIRHSNVDGEHP